MSDHSLTPFVGISAPDLIESLFDARRLAEKLTHEQSVPVTVPPDFDALEVFATPGELRSDRAQLVASVKNMHNAEALYVRLGALIYLVHHHGSMTVKVAARARKEVVETLEWAQAQMPVYEPMADTIPVTFWAATARGPMQVRRQLDADPWGAISENYPVRTRAELARMMTGEFKPGLGGQLVLWNGDPGTGKTTALRTLAREWSGWCDMHYIVDPDEFFGGNAAYLMNVLMEEESDEIPAGAGERKASRWRVLVLEDCGELLAVNAREEVGQGLSRLLNACDGMIGRGLRVLVLITTNEPLSALHPAVRRPGRCAAKLEFERFDTRAAFDWLDAHDVPSPRKVSGRPTLADLYGIAEGFGVSERDDSRVGFHA